MIDVVLCAMILYHCPAKVALHWNAFLPLLYSDTKIINLNLYIFIVNIFTDAFLFVLETQDALCNRLYASLQFVYMATRYIIIVFLLIARNIRAIWTLLSFNTHVIACMHTVRSGKVK